jgi:4-amino-4-deoxy-L-arabinose transferase-like glycosyltransferase
MTETIRRNERRDQLIVLAAAFVVPLVVVLAVFRSQGLVQNTPDPYAFSQLGKEVARGQGFHGELLGRRAPLYPLFVGALYWIFGEHERVVQIAQCLLLACTALMAHDIGRRLYNARTGLIAGLICAVHPSLLRYVPDFHLEELLTFTVTLAIWSSVVFFQRPRLKNAVLFGAATGLACLTKAVFMLYPPIFAVIWLWRQRRDGEDLKKAVLTMGTVALAMGLVIAPWTIRNYRVSGHFVPISTGVSDAFLRGYVFTKIEYATLRQPPYTGAENEVNAWFRDISAKAGTTWERDPVADDRILGAEAKIRLRAAPLDFVRKFSVGLFTFWYEMTSLKTSLVAGMIALGSWVLAAIGFRRSRKERREQWLLLVPIIYLNVFLALLLSLGRYSVPVLPALSVLAAFGIDTLVSSVRGRRTV